MASLFLTLISHLIVSTVLDAPPYHSQLFTHKTSQAQTNIYGVSSIQIPDIFVLLEVLRGVNLAAG